jgi:ankyrin repeat protein
LKVLEQLVNE